MCSINASQSSPKSWSHGDSSNSQGFVRQSNRRRGRKGPGRPQTAHIADPRTETRHVSAGVVGLKQVSFKKEVGVMVIDLVFRLTVCLILKMCY